MKLDSFSRTELKPLLDSLKTRVFEQISTTENREAIKRSLIEEGNHES